MEINYQGHTISINERLLDEQDVWKNLKGIIHNRIAISVLLDQANHMYIAKTLNKKNGKKVLDLLTKLEYDLQRQWGFSEDKNYHTYQYELKGCKCAVMDNRERLGTPYKIVHPDCPYHTLEVNWYEEDYIIN